MVTVPIILNCKLIYVFVVVLKLKGPVLIIPSNVYGVTVEPVTVTMLLSSATWAVSSSTIFVICIVPDPDAYITLWYVPPEIVKGAVTVGFNLHNTVVFVKVCMLEDISIVLCNAYGGTLVAL